jgi:homoserine kinase
MQQSDKKKAFRIPASTANLGSGFDALGLALARYLRIGLEPADRLAITVVGRNVDRIPTDETNLIYKVAANTARRRNRPLPPFHMEIDNEIPLARGMGSSAAAIIAGITCYEILTGDELDEQELFRCAFDFEDHPDNLGACLYGGLIAGVAADDGTVQVARLQIPCRLSTVVVIPSFELSTGLARAVLPKTYSFHDIIYNTQRSALTIAALTTCNKKLFREAMRDRIHQPYRAKLIPGLEEILELRVDGLLGVALSGAGPTVFAFVEPELARSVGDAIAGTYKQHGVEAIPLLIEIDTLGRVIDP